MSCDKHSSKLDRCGNVVPSNCVKYVGEEKDCIDLCTGISLTDVIETISDAICDVKTEIDISDINVPDCFDIDDLTFVNVLTALLNKDCSLQEQIDAINSELEGFNPIIEVEFGCLEDNPCFSSGLHLKEILEIIIVELCNLKAVVAAQAATISAQQAQIVSLQAQVSTLNSTLSTLSCNFTDLYTYLNTQLTLSFTPTC